MCKVAGVTKVTDKNRNDVWVFMQLLGELMSPGNDDGLGYAAITSKGKIFGERWLINQTAFKDLTQIKGINAAKLEKIYAYFGDKVARDDAQAIILHTRAATCGKGIENTHPFIDDQDDPNVAIIHNGMIYNHMDFSKKYSTCDSEVIAHLYKEAKMNTDLSKLNDFSKKMEGWYTVLALTNDNTGKMVMDAFSDSGRLGSYFIPELDTRVWSTQADDVMRVAKTLGLSAIQPLQIKEDTAFRLDVLTGEQIAFTKFETKPRVGYGIDSGWEGWANVTTMDGNLDDKAFVARWFGNRSGGFSGD